MILPEEKINAIKSEVSRRAPELGKKVNPRQISLEFMNINPVEKWVAFHAYWGNGDRQRSLSGLFIYPDDIDTYPARALGKIFKYWTETAGKFPAPEEVAAISAYLFDSDKRHTLILNETDKLLLIKRKEWLPHIKMPELIEVAGYPGIEFSWVSSDGASGFRAYLDGKNRLQTQESYYSSDDDQ